MSIVVIPSKIFVVGASRSGTTMMARMLKAHSRVHMFTELHFFERMVSGEEFLSSQSLGREKTRDLAALLISAIEDGFFSKRRPDLYLTKADEVLGKGASLSAAEIFDRVCHAYCAENSAQAVCEQTPRNVFYIQEILEKYPDAVFLNMVRDPRAVLLSQKNKWRIGLRKNTHLPPFEAFRAWCNYHPLVMSRLWRSAIDAGRVERSEVLTVQYEQLVENPEVMMRKVCAHCGLDFEPQMLEVTQLGSSARGDTGKTGVDKGRVDAWRKGGLRASEISICESQAGTVMQDLGYEPLAVRVSPLALVGQYLLLPVKAVAALMTNLSRSRSLLSWARKRLATPTS